MYKSYFKEIFDFIFSFLGIILFIPLLLIVSLLLIITFRSTKVLFLQIRPGKYGKLFRVIKFKTMNDTRAENGLLLPDCERITKIGKIIRSLSIDEVPQLFNVLKGDMSLVGPRPLLVEYMNLYTDEQARRHNVKPGITGWAQVNGRNTISWEKKFEYDVWYVDNLSFYVDLKILFLTIKKVLIKDGINASKNITMEEFK